MMNSQTHRKTKRPHSLLDQVSINHLLVGKESIAIVLIFYFKFTPKMSLLSSCKCEKMVFKNGSEGLGVFFIIFALAGATKMYHIAIYLSHLYNLQLQFKSNFLFLLAILGFAHLHVKLITLKIYCVPDRFFNGWLTQQR